MPVFRIRAASHGCQGSVRLTKVAANMSRAALDEPVAVEPSGNDRVILIGSTPCVTVTEADAARCATTPGLLAKTWAGRLRDALHLPRLKFADPSLVVPVGASRDVLLVGSLADDVNISSSPDQVIKVERTEDGVLIHALGVGHGEVSVSAQGIAKTLNVKVLPLAADLPASITAEVTGVPSTESTVAGAVKSALKLRLRGKPGANFFYDFRHAAPLPTGDSRSFAVPVRAAAPNAFPVSSSITVQVKNLPVPREADTELWYSNNPELITHPTNLFAAMLKLDAPVRLLYHHTNGSTQWMYFRVEVINTTDTPARVAIIPGDSRPDGNPVLAGLEAASEYFRAWTIGSAEVVTIPPNCSIPVSFHRLTPGDTESGLCGLRLISGPPELLVRTDAWPAFVVDPVWRPALQSSTPWRVVGSPPVSEFDRAPYVLSEHIYPDPHRVEEMSYAVGGRYGFLRVGTRPIPRQDRGSQLDGNFGVVYNIKASMSNPTQEPTDVEVVFEASAGYSGGLFLIDGNFIRTPLLQPKDETRIGRYRLMPGDIRRLDITTIPLSGSSYPATLLIRPIIKGDDPAEHTAARSRPTKRKVNK